MNLSVCIEDIRPHLCIVYDPQDLLPVTWLVRYHTPCTSRILDAIRCLIEVFAFDVQVYIRVPSLAFDLNDFYRECSDLTSCNIGSPDTIKCSIEVTDVHSVIVILNHPKHTTMVRLGERGNR